MDGVYSEARSLPVRAPFAGRSFLETGDPLSVYGSWLTRTAKWKAITAADQHKNEPNAPKAGDMAIDFTTYSPDGKDTFKLSQHYAEKPVLISFGSIT